MATRTHTMNVTQVLAAVRGRDLGCEGIPMFLALHGGMAAPEGDGRRLWGERLAAGLSAIHDEVLRLDAHPTSRSEGRIAQAAESAILDGREGAGPAADHALGDDSAVGNEQDADQAVSEPERTLAEAIAVLAHAELSEPRIEIELPSGGPSSPPGTPLRRMQDALREGRFLTVVNYHNTPASSAAGTADELARWGRRLAPVRPEDLMRLFAEGTWTEARPPLIPVFYEGYRNNCVVGGPACEQAGLIGWFFLITGFLDAAPDAQEAFARAHDIALAEEELGAVGGALAMSWSQAAALAHTHVVTSHTATHAAAHRVREPGPIQAELIAPSERIRQATGSPSVAHAWLFGSDLAHDRTHLPDLQRSGYRWLFSNTGIDDIAAWSRGAAR